MGGSYAPAKTELVHFSGFKVKILMNAYNELPSLKKGGSSLKQIRAELRLE